MRFIARITVEIEADTFAAAADHEREIKKSYQALKSTYQDCHLEIKQRRTARVKETRPRQKLVRYTGKLSNYTA